jgi:hypothetical protein
MGKSILALGTIDYPFSVDRTFIGQVQLNARKYPDDAAVRGVVAQLRDRLAALPGVRQASVGTNVPGGGSRMAFIPEGDTAAPTARRPMVQRVSVTPDYFDTLHLPVLRGRGLTTLDREGTLPVAVISEDFARRFFPDGDPIGRRFRLGRSTDDASPWLTVVGIVPKVAVMLQSGQMTETATRTPSSSRCGGWSAASIPTCRWRARCRSATATTARPGRSAFSAGCSSRSAPARWRWPPRACTA